MAIGDVMTAITTVGFPIVMCLIMMWYIKYISDKHKDETEQFTESLNKNTIVLQKLCDIMGVEREE